MAQVRMNRRFLLRTGLAATAALGAAALPGLGGATAAGSHPGAGGEAVRPDRDSDLDAHSGQVIRTWNETARAQAFGNVPSQESAVRL